MIAALTSSGELFKKLPEELKDCGDNMQGDIKRITDWATIFYNDPW